eukprot:TRINITY_DN2057_c0_g4_i2.p1 TRINITY_DN2057_c0_g4~~TRINITY_DN2057_c0_g4_i2.p1  ORF type:complete len:213 (-),score=22.11 TRINITY_DN2057_c0_g4_i2:45-683(-)
METAALLDLPQAKWVTDFYLRERDKGVLDGISSTERQKNHSDELKRRELDTFYWAPSGGESIANCCLRVDRILSQLRDQCSGFRVILVCHGDIMTAFRIRMERIGQHDYTEDMQGPKPTMNNCQIIHYSRRNPFTGNIHESVNWMRLVTRADGKDPDGVELEDDGWKQIIRPDWTNEQLLETVNNIPQLVNNRKEDLDKDRWIFDDSSADRS